MSLGAIITKHVQRSDRQREARNAAHIARLRGWIKTSPSQKPAIQSRQAVTKDCQTVVVKPELVSGAKEKDMPVSTKKVPAFVSRKILADETGVPFKKIYRLFARGELTPDAFLDEQPLFLASRISEIQRKIHNPEIKT